MSLKIRLANNDDRLAIQKFIKYHWSQGHIFSKSNSFFEYEMCPKGIPNFIVAILLGKIIGIVGFICNREQIIESDLFLVMFRVLKIKESSSVGLKLIKYAKSITNCGVHTLGANEKVLPYYKFLGFKTGFLDHYYWLSNDTSIIKKFLFNKNDFNNLKSSTKLINKTHNLERISIADIEDITFSINIGKAHSLLKSKEFFLRRFCLHPIYKYQFFKKSNSNDILVIREVMIGNDIAWRIIDFYGNKKNFAKVCKELVRFAPTQNISFIDLYVLGISKEDLLNCGLREINDNVVIPNYLNPLVMKNIKISYVTSNSHKPFFLRGDCDLDRPSSNNV